MNSYLSTKDKDKLGRQIESDINLWRIVSEFNTKYQKILTNYNSRAMVCLGISLAILVVTSFSEISYNGIIEIALTVSFVFSLILFFYWFSFVETSGKLRYISREKLESLKVFFNPLSESILDHLDKSFKYNSGSIEYIKNEIHLIFLQNVNGLNSKMFVTIDIDKMTVIVTTNYHD